MEPAAENTDWFFDCDILDDFNWVPPAVLDSTSIPAPAPAPTPPCSDFSVEIDSYLNTSDGFKEQGSNKRLRPEEPCSGRMSKACRERMRRNKLNERFLELGAALDPGKPPKVDKAALLSDATTTVIQLRDETQQLKDTNESLEEKIKELKAEKDELRDEKQKLKEEKERLEQRIDLMRATPAYLPQLPVMQAPFAAQGQIAGQKLVMPYVSYPGYHIPMHQFMTPLVADTSKDAESFPPVA